MGVVQKLCGWEEKERGGESGEGERRRKEKRFKERMSGLSSSAVPRQPAQMNSARK